MVDPILEKAKLILAKRERDETIVKAGLCPECGEELEDWTSRSYYGKKCSKNKEHYETTHLDYF